MRNFQVINLCKHECIGTFPNLHECTFKIKYLHDYKQTKDTKTINRETSVSKNLSFPVVLWILPCILSIKKMLKKLKKLEISQHSQMLRCERTNYTIVCLHMCNTKCQILRLNTFKVLIKEIITKKHENMHLMELLDTSFPDFSILA